MRGYVSSLVSAKAATIGLQAATIALNAAISMGVMLAIQLVIKAFDELIKTNEEVAESAKKAFLSELRGKKPEVKDGTVTGFDEFLKQYRETDSKAFVDEKSEQLESSKARFTAPIENNTSGRKNDDTLRRAFGLPPRKD